MGVGYRMVLHMLPSGVKGDLDKWGQRSPKVGQQNNSETLRDGAKVSIEGK
jgi:hypothetical protein